MATAAMVFGIVGVLAATGTAALALTTGAVAALPDTMTIGWGTLAAAVVGAIGVALIRTRPKLSTMLLLLGGVFGGLVALPFFVVSAVLSLAHGLRPASVR